MKLMAELPKDSVLNYFVSTKQTPFGVDIIIKTDEGQTTSHSAILRIHNDGYLWLDPGFSVPGFQNGPHGHIRVIKG